MNILEAAYGKLYNVEVGYAHGKHDLEKLDFRGILQFCKSENIRFLKALLEYNTTMATWKYAGMFDIVESSLNLSFKNRDGYIDNLDLIEIKNNFFEGKWVGTEGNGLVSIQIL